MFPISFICSIIIGALLFVSFFGGFVWSMLYIVRGLDLVASLIPTIIITIISMIFGGYMGFVFSIYCSPRQICNCVTCDCIPCCDDSSDDDCPDCCCCSDDCQCCC